MQEKAVPLWKQLEAVAVYPENKRYAMFNLMRSYYQSQNLEEAQSKAEAVLKLKNIEVKVKWDAYEILDLLLTQMETDFLLFLIRVMLLEKSIL